LSQSSRSNQSSRPTSRLPKKISAQSPLQKSRLLSSRTSQRLLGFDRRLGVRFVAGADEAGRGSLAGPLVVAGVLLDYDSLRDHRVRPLAQLNDSKQVRPEDREELFGAVLAAATQISVQMISHAEIDREGLHRSNLEGLRRALHALTPPAEACLVDGFSSHVGYITPGHSRIVRERGPCEIHRRSFQALCYLSEEEAAARLAAV
jgi:ribonuclease HII